MNVTPADYQVLKAMYDQAVKDKKETFEFRSTILLVSYAKYLLEYLKSQRNA